MNTLPPTPALSTASEVIAVATALSSLADRLHETLRRLTSESSSDTTIAYALLTEEYALRARVNILINDAPRHTLDGLEFSQAKLLETLSGMSDAFSAASSLEVVRSRVSDLITFASALCPGKAKTVNFLAAELGVRG